MSDTSSGERKKRLAMFMDGTWNVVGDNTNVWRLRALFAPVSSDGCAQRAYYSTGLGTKFGERLRDGMFGRGINTAITSAYEWLMENYEPDDEIFIFGFSRRIHGKKPVWVRFQVWAAAARRSTGCQSTIQAISPARSKDHSDIDRGTKGR